MMRPGLIAICLLSLFFSSTVQLQAQHCAPIVESYLSGTRIQRTEDGINLSFHYTKTGGQMKSAYQAYLLAYPGKFYDAIEQASPQKALADKHALILQTVLAKRNESGEYEFAFQLTTKTFVQQLLDANLISHNEVDDFGGWKRFAEPIRLAVFIPFLEDKEYSTLAKLPAEKHECNYSAAPALLFESLSSEIDVCFGIVQAVQLKEGEYYIEWMQRPKKVEAEKPAN